MDCLSVTAKSVEQAAAAKSPGSAADKQHRARIGCRVGEMSADDNREARKRAGGENGLGL